MIFAAAIAMPWAELVAGSLVWGIGEVVQGVLGNLGITVLSVVLHRARVAHAVGEDGQAHRVF